MDTPIVFSKAFAPGGYDSRPIQTLASAQINNPYMRKTSDKVQNNGLPDAKNKTTLGAYRMGESDTSTGAIYPDTTHAPIPPAERVYPQVQFMNTGNNVYQPDRNNAALHSLLTRYGDQKFKVQENEPFARYLAEQRLEKEIKQVERTAGLEELTQAREIIRSAVAQRRKQNEDDYLRRMLDAGLSADDAQDEIDNVRRASALQEARKPEDRAYQSKLLLVRLANQRGILSKVNEPITSASIMNPQPNQQIASALGTPEIGFGSSPLDIARQFQTPEYFKRILRRSNLTQESADREGALNNLISQGAEDETRGTFFPAMLQGREREAAIEAQRTAAAQRLEMVRNIGRKIVAPLFTFVIAPDLLQSLFSDIKLEQGNPVRYKILDIQNANRTDLLLAYNRYILSDPGNITKVKNAFSDLYRGRGEGVSVILPDIDAALRKTLIDLSNQTETMIPVYTGNKRITTPQLNGAVQRLRLATDADITTVNRVARDQGAGLEELGTEGLPVIDSSSPLSALALSRNQRRNLTRSRRMGSVSAGLPAEMAMGGGGGAAAPSTRRNLKKK